MMAAFLWAMIAPTVAVYAVLGLAMVRDYRRLRRRQRRARAAEMERWYDRTYNNENERRCP